MYAYSGGNTARLLRSYERSASAAANSRKVDKTTWGRRGQRQATEERFSEARRRGKLESPKKAKRVMNNIGYSADHEDREGRGGECYDTNSKNLENVTSD